MSVRFYIGLGLLGSVVLMAVGAGLVWGLGIGCLVAGVGFFVLCAGAAKVED